MGVLMHVYGGTYCNYISAVFDFGMHKVRKGALEKEVHNSFSCKLLE